MGRSKKSRVMYVYPLFLESRMKVKTMPAVTRVVTGVTEAIMAVMGTS